MQYKANTPEAYIAQTPPDRQEALQKLRALFQKNLPKGFEEQMSYGMLGFVVPHSLYPDGYHCKPEQPLPFINIASQKKFVALYHSGIYANPDLHDWFVTEYPKHSKRKLDMGKSCIRFKYMDDIPYQLLEVLAKKITVKQWISTYEKNVKNK
ncbi:DUF1801 domain-containing protein [Maribacter sp. 2-571]|uniref:DUF1801 domain-containing protein n=1 Tax=Maribacter sp. 2-571 TaxID=3417569 RepID=UPI003D34129D